MATADPTTLDSPASPARLKDSLAMFGGLTKREHAAIALGVPRSGDPELDAMIRESNLRRASEAALQGLIARHARGMSIEFPFMAEAAKTSARHLVAALDERDGGAV